MKMKFKTFMEKVLAYFEDNFEAIMSLGYAGTMLFTMIYLICASVSVAKHGISYRR